MRPWLARVTLVSALGAGACATAAVTSIGGGDGGVTPDSGSPADAGSDGACVPACKSTEVCSNGACKAQCDAPLVKCSGDAGTCVDLTKDSKNCGQCGTVCNAPDGGPEGGAGNPDSGLPPADGGVVSSGWSLPAPGCSTSKCGLTCAAGDLCSDNLCWDTQAAHDHCGTCTTACASTEHCNKGKCCGFGQANCNGTCTDVLTNNTNCGACGNTCSGGTPFCSGGVCTAGVSYSQAFTTGATPVAQCTAWNTFRTSLTGTYSTVTLSGSNDLVGRSCTGSGANTICQALRNGTALTSFVCGAYTWNVGTCGNGMELSAQAGNCTCISSASYTVRPCINNLNWGGVNTTNCGAASQTLTVTCK